MTDFKKWDVWLANVMFEDCLNKKKRPVTILSENKVFVLSLKMTSHEARYLTHKGEYELLKWKEAGLLKPTVVRCSKLLQLDKNDMIKRLGRLDNVDINSISVLLKYLYGSI